MSRVTIELSSEAEAVHRQKASELGLTLETYLQKLASEIAANGNTNGPNLQDTSPEAALERANAFREWIVQHGVPGIVADDSRETIYAGRGE